MPSVFHLNGIQIIPHYNRMMNMEKVWKWDLTSAKAIFQSGASSEGAPCQEWSSYSFGDIFTTNNLHLRRQLLYRTAVLHDIITPASAFYWQENTTTNERPDRGMASHHPPTSLCVPLKRTPVLMKPSQGLLLSLSQRLPHPSLLDSIHFGSV